MNQHSDFAAQVLSNLAATLGLSYEQIAASHIERPRPFIRPKVIRLMMTDDQRKWNRAWRIYFADNGKGAPRSYLTGIVGQYRVAAAKQAWTAATNKMLKQWAIENGLATDN